MSFRAVLIGLVLGVLLAAFGYRNDSVLHMTSLVGNHLPISVFGMLIVITVVINPALWLLRRSWRLAPAELAVIVALMLVSASIPGSGLMRTFTQTLALPAQYYRSTPGWKKYELFRYVPADMTPGRRGLTQQGQIDPYDPAVMDRFLSGAGGKGLVPVSDVPWSKWVQPLCVWGPIILLTSVGLVCLSLIVHRQWASRERLRYPIAEFATALAGQDAKKALGPVFRSGLFWAGLVVVLAIRVNNGIHMFYKEETIEVPLKFSFPSITQTFPALGQAPHAWALVAPEIFPTVVAFGFFLASDVSLSLGLSQYLIVPILAWLMVLGVDVSGDYMAGGPQEFQVFGSYFGLAMVLLYMGRRYYWQVVQQGILFRCRQEVEPYAAWALRVLLLCVAGVVAILIWQGLEWPFAILLVGLVLLMFLVMARINAESGTFFVQPGWQPVGVLLGLFGAAALGPKALVILGLISAVLTIDPRECLMPFVVNGLKMCDASGVRPGRTGWAASAVFAVALAVAVPSVLWVNYSSSEPQSDGWAYKNVPKFPFNTAEREVTKLTLADELKQSEQYTPWQRLKNIKPEPRFVWPVLIGVALVMVFSALRLRFTWWPLHPILFVVWGTYPMRLLNHSFLIGWLVKLLVTKLGGGQKYRQVRTFMIGAVAGDLLGGVVFMVVGAIYYHFTGHPPEAYRILPG